MAQITSSVGLISGINTTALINSLIQEDSGPVNLLTNRVSVDQTLGEAYAAIGTQLQTIQTTAKALELPTTFSATTANSSNPAVLTATTTDAAAVGTYSLQVARLVATQQLVGAGFTDATNAKVGAGTITIGLGGGSSLATETPLSDLNGGDGVGRGQFRITDRSGATAVIDTTAAVSLDDVVDAINTATTISVRASVQDDHLVLTDASGKTASNLIVQDLGTGTSAADLGIAANVASDTVTGTDVNTISRNTQLAQLNDGRGVGVASGGGNDFTFTTRDGTAVGVSVGTAATVGDVVDAINAAGGGKLTATVDTATGGIKVVDATAGGHAFAVAADNGSTAARDLGLTAAVTGGDTIAGGGLLGSLDTTLLSSLNGGSGLTLGSVKFTDAAGGQATVDLSGAKTVQDVIADINAATGAHVTAAVDAAGTGLQVTDASGGTGTFTIADADATHSATALGLAGSAPSGESTVQGGDLHKQSVTSATRLSTLNGGAGVNAGTFTITTAAGATATINLAVGNVKTVGDLLYQINSKGVAGLTASVNATGNGILLSDASTGSGKLTVTDTSGTAAADLNLAGAAGFGQTTIDGAYEKTIAVTANDTLTTVAAAINAANAGVTASVIDDGSATAPYRLSLTATNSGTAGQVQFDSGATNLDTRTLVKAQDAAVFVGGTGTSGAAGQPLLVTSGTNTVANVIPGVTLTLTGASTAPVQLTVAQDADGIVKQVSTLVTTINGVSAGIDSANTYNTSNQTAGLFLGDGPTQQILASLLGSVTAVASAGVGQYKSLAAVGITIGSNDQVTFDESTFRQALATDPAAVESLFDATSTVTNSDGTKTTTNHGLAYNFDKVLTTLVDPVSGTLTVAENTLTTEVTQFQDQITSLNALLDQKRAVYETQFANMEEALAQLQSQQQALSSIGTVASTSSASNIGSSAGSSSSTDSSSTDSSGSSTGTSTGTSTGS